MLEIIRTAAPYTNISKQCSLLQTNFYCKCEIVMTKGNIYTPWCPNVQHMYLYNSTMRHLWNSYISILTNLIYIDTSFVVPNVWFIFLEPVYRNLFFFYRSDFSIFRDVIGGAFRTLKQCVYRMYPSVSIFSEIFLSCFLRKIISYNLKHLYIKHLYIRCNYFFVIYTYLIITYFEIKKQPREDFFERSFP